MERPVETHPVVDKAVIALAVLVLTSRLWRLTLRSADGVRGRLYGEKSWSGARDLNPRLHGPEMYAVTVGLPRGAWADGGTQLLPDGGRAAGGGGGVALRSSRFEEAAAAAAP
jgi:hypothetical protein